MVMRGPDGKDHPFKGVYIEIVEPERIVFKGTIHEEPGHEAWTTVTFAEQEGKTKTHRTPDLFLPVGGDGWRARVGARA